MIKIDLSQKIEVDLTDLGEKILVNHYRKKHKNSDDATIASMAKSKFADRYEFVLIELFEIFGNKINECIQDGINFDESITNSTSIPENMILFKTSRQQLSFNICEIRIDKKTGLTGEYIKLSIMEDQDKKSDSIDVKLSYTQNALKTFF